MSRARLDQAGRSPLHYAAADGDVRTVTTLIKAGADVNLKDKAGFTPLHFASQEQQVETTRLLLESGARVDEKDSRGGTPLSRAVFYYRGNNELIPLLRKWGADPLVKNDNGISPLELARQIANYDVAKFFEDIS